MEPTKASAGPFVGLGALVCVGFLDGASILFLPWWAVALLCASWLLLLVAGAHAFGHRPRQVVPIALTGLVLWLVAVGLAVLLA